MTITSPSKGRRGSTILLVLAMLSILLLLGVAFSYSTRLESQASFNYAELTQARTAASSGLPTALPMLVQAAQGLTAPVQGWSTIPQALNKMVNADGKASTLSAGEMAALNQAGLHVRQTKSGELESAPQANVQIRDLSGLINLNAVADQNAMERIVSAVLPGGKAKKQSFALMALRGDLPTVQGRSQPSNAHSKNKALNMDLRDPNAQLLDSLQRLRLDEQSGNQLFSSEEIKKLSSYVTVFSQAPEIYNGPNNVHVPRIPLDNIEAEHVYETLRTAFPYKNNELLLQFAANVADFSDKDDQPTILDSRGKVVAAVGGVTETSNVTIGVEMTPLISEVYPDAATSVGFDDDGQFVEIANPWNQVMNLAGWTLRAGSGSQIPLTAQLPPGGFLVITDNYDQPKPKTPPGYGSLVSLFGATADGARRQVMTQPSLNLKDRNDEVSLYNPQGQLVDVFAYKSTGAVDGKSSFQRVDPLVRGVKVAPATPFAAASGGMGNSASMADATKAWKDGNTTMTKVSQLFTLSTGFVEHDSELSGSDQVHPSQMAELQLPADYSATNSNTNTDPWPDNMDIRLVDVFTATPSKIAPDSQNQSDVAEDGNNNKTRNRSNVKNAYQAFQVKMDRLRQRNRPEDANTDETTVPTVYSYGKLNLNTCSKFALLGLNLDSAAANNGGMTGMIEQFEGYRMTKTQRGGVPFLNVSDFIEKFAPGLSRGNLDELDNITDQVSVGSSAFEITSTNRLSPKEQKVLDDHDRTAPRPATATAKWVVSMDQKPYSVVSYSLQP